MAKKTNINARMRSLHRDLGYFLTGIMAMYAISGTILIFRKTDFMKMDVVIEKTIEPNLNIETLGEAIKKKGLKAEESDGRWIYEGGAYNPSTGDVSYTVKEYPYVLDKMTHLHKATTNDPLFYFNIFFGFALLFFVVSAFWMYTPKMPVFRKGLYFALAGAGLLLILLFV